MANIGEQDHQQPWLDHGPAIGSNPFADAGQSFDSFYRENVRDVIGLAHILSGSRTASEELAQDAFTAAYKKWGTISSYDNPGAWVRRVLVNRSRSWGRRKSAELRAVTRLTNRRQPLGELTLDDHEFWEAVRSLPDQQAKALALHYYEDLPTDQIAKILNCSESSVRTHLQRGRRNLATTLDLKPDSDNTNDAWRQQ